MFKDEITPIQKEYIRNWINENRQALNAKNIKEAVSKIDSFSKREIIVSYLLLSSIDFSFDFVTPVEYLLEFIDKCFKHKTLNTAVSCGAVAAYYRLANDMANIRDYGKISMMLGFDAYEEDPDDEKFYDCIIADRPALMYNWIGQRNSRGSRYTISDFIFHPAWR